MLVLSRKCGEAIVVGDGVTVTVLELRGRQVRLGITAPVEVQVHREEVFTRIQRQAIHGDGVPNGSGKDAAIPRPTLDDWI